MIDLTCLFGMNLMNRLKDCVDVPLNSHSLFSVNLCCRVPEGRWALE